MNTTYEAQRGPDLDLLTQQRRVEIAASSGFGEDVARHLRILKENGISQRRVVGLGVAAMEVLNHADQVADKDRQVNAVGYEIVETLSRSAFEEGEPIISPRGVAVILESGLNSHNQDLAVTVLLRKNLLPSSYRQELMYVPERASDGIVQQNELHDKEAPEPEIDEVELEIAKGMLYLAQTPEELAESYAPYEHFNSAELVNTRNRLIAGRMDKSYRWETVRAWYESRIPEQDSELEAIISELHDKKLVEYAWQISYTGQFDLLMKVLSDNSLQSDNETYEQQYGQLRAEAMNRTLLA